MKCPCGNELSTGDTYGICLTCTNRQNLAEFAQRIEGALSANFDPYNENTPEQRLAYAASLIEQRDAAIRAEARVEAMRDDYRMDQLDAVMYSVDKWFDEGDKRLLQNPANRAVDAREIALRKIEAIEDESAKEIEKASEWCDLMVDEFIRISHLTNNGEIKGLCDRAIVNTVNNFPLMKQRDDIHKRWCEALQETERIRAESAQEIAESRKEIAALKEMLDEMTNKAEDSAHNFAARMGNYRKEAQAHNFARIAVARALLAEREEPK